MDSKTKTATLTPEYYAVRHCSQFIGAGTTIVAYREGKADHLPVLVAATPRGKLLVMTGNCNETSKSVAVKLGGCYLNATLPVHSFNTFQLK